MTKSDLAETAAAAFQAELCWLARLHLVLGVVTAAMAPLGGYLFWTGWSLLQDPAMARQFDGPAMLDPLLWGATIAMLGGVLATLSLMHGLILCYVGRLIAQRRRHRFCLVFSIFDLTYIPLGAALSVFALVLLTRPEVKARFDQPS